MEHTEETQETLTGRAPAPAPRWLRALCDREWKIPAPIAFELDGERWIAAVTHCQAVAIRSDAEADEAPADIAEKLRAWLSQPTPLRLPRDAIRVAISRPLPSEGCKDEWPIEIDGATFNARLLRRALRHLPVGDEVAVSETVTSEDGDRPPIFAGDGWRIALMPLVPLAKHAPRALLARFRRDGDRIVLDAPQSREAPAPKPIAAKPPAPAKPAPLADAPTVPMERDPMLASIAPIPNVTEAPIAVATSPTPPVVELPDLRVDVPRIELGASSLRVYVAAAKQLVVVARDAVSMLRDDACIHVVSRWQHKVEEGQDDPADDATMTAILRENLEDLRKADIVLAFTTRDAGRGVYGEIGRALAMGKLVVWSLERGGRCQDIADERVIVATTDEKAIQTVRTLAAWRRAA